MDWRFHIPNLGSTSRGFGDDGSEPKQQTQPPPASTANPDDALSAPQLDPFRNLREEREKGKQSGFEYDPFSINKKLI